MTIVRFSFSLRAKSECSQLNIVRARLRELGGKTLPRSFNRFRRSDLLLVTIMLLLNLFNCLLNVNLAVMFIRLRNAELGTAHKRINDMSHLNVSFAD